MSLTEYNEAEFIKHRRAEGREEGIAEGFAKGRAEGRKEGKEEGIAEGKVQGIINLCCSMNMSKSDTMEKIVHLTDITAEQAEEYINRFWSE